MRLPLTVALSFLTAMGVLGFESDCSPGSTTVLVTDCSGAPVEGARIDITVCCGARESRSAVTEVHGLATFDLNAREICDGKVSFAGLSPTSFGTGSCTAPGKEGKSKCTVQVCKR